MKNRALKVGYWALAVQYFTYQQPMKPRQTVPARGHWKASFFLLVGLFLAGCASPVGVRETGFARSYRQVHRTVLTGKRWSDASRVALHRFDLEQRFRTDPLAALRVLHAKACLEDHRDLLFALAELSYATGQRCRNGARFPGFKHATDFFLASAVYAYFYLFDPSEGPAPSPYDRRFRTACDLYNYALQRAFASVNGRRVLLESGVRRLPVGRLRVTLATEGLPQGMTNFSAFLPADEFLVRGLTVRNRDPGLGAPLIGVRRQSDDATVARWPLTLFLRIHGRLTDLASGQCQARLGLYSTFTPPVVRVGTQRVPLETDSTVNLALELNDYPTRRVDLGLFLAWFHGIRTGITLTQPYEPGRIPVVFVPGTASSPIWWAEMWNTLRADPLLRRRCQIWTYTYDSGNPIFYSAVQFREALTRWVHRLDPNGRDPALRQMVIVGHSQGGLLAKLTATDTGDRLWRAFLPTSLEKPNATCREIANPLTPSLSPTGGEGAQRAGEKEPRGHCPSAASESLRQYLVFKPLPFVRSVVFIATPHRGSFRANQWVRWLARHLIHLPQSVVELTDQLLRLSTVSHLPDEFRYGTPTSLDSMSPNNRLLLTLAKIPLAPGVTGHSIIAVKTKGDPHRGNDGVVTYASAHVNGVASELLVHSGHSCQQNPQVIEEVRRILRAHVRTVDQAASASAHPSQRAK